MIYMRIWEGLGNQMFQYAYIRSLQLRNTVDVRLCVLPDQTTRTLRQYELDKLRIKVRRDKGFENIAQMIERNNWMKKVLHTASDVFPQFGYIEEEDTHYNKHLLNIKGNYYISGWFQNEKYFKDYETIIKKELYPKRKIKISEELRYIMDNKNTVSIHFRRGDYKQLNNLVRVDYYKKAMELIDSYLDNVFYIVFSDDLNWVVNHMSFGDNVYFINREHGLEDYEELFIMSKCKNNIVANSTFSWWGAWLNDNKSKIVIGPKKWFANNKLNIMPDEWIKL